MGFWDRFKRKKVILIPEEKQENQAISSVPEQRADTNVPGFTFSAPTLSQAKALKVIKRRKKIKKRKVMKKRVKPKRRKVAAKSLGSDAVNMDDSSAGKKWLQKDRELLGGALRDLNRELQSLRNARKKLELDMADFSSQLGNTQDKEISLRNKISELMKKEAAITKKKAIAKDKLALVDQKMEKVRSIQAELKNV